MTLKERQTLDKRYNDIMRATQRKERLINMMNDVYEAFDIKNNPTARAFYAQLHEELIKEETAC